MHKTDKDLYTDPNEKIIESRYMTNSKKKYYLASVDENVEILKQDQINKLTQLLIELKSQYDELIRETTSKNNETKELEKKIEMLGKMDKKIKEKNEEVLESNEAMKEAIACKKVKRDEELYTKATLLNFIEKLKDDILLIKKDLTLSESKCTKLSKRLQKEKLFENEIREKFNSVYSMIISQKHKNQFDNSEQQLVLQYYQKVIDQKWTFISSADVRKEKQGKIAQEAKLDSQDKQEVEARKTLELLHLYNRYLRLKMKDQLGENEKMEETFQAIRDITGTSNLKVMVDKILQKDKNYNLYVGKVSEKETRIEILKKDINALQAQVIALQNELVLGEEQTLKKTLSTTPSEIKLEEDETHLIKEEYQLTEALKLLQEKHKNVKLVYEKVVENIKSLCKIDRKPPPTETKTDAEPTTTQLQNISAVNDSKIIDTSSLNIPTLQIQVNEDDLYNSYVAFLENTRKTMDMLFLCHSKMEFLNLMKEKGVEANSQNSNRINSRFLTKKKTATIAGKPGVKETGEAKQEPKSEEYDYNDEVMNEEEKQIQEHILKAYRIEEMKKVSEFLKTDKKK